VVSLLETLKVASGATEDGGGMCPGRSMVVRSKIRGEWNTRETDSARGRTCDSSGNIHWWSFHDGTISEYPEPSTRGLTLGLDAVSRRESVAGTFLRRHCESGAKRCVVSTVSMGRLGMP
jgi:hypothetical protein